MQPRELLVTARILVRSKRGHPTDTSLRRAISTGYYAMFHFICRECADLLIGPRKSARNEEAWRQVYRSLDHKPAKMKCKHGMMANFPEEIRVFADLFATMQDKRHDADYNPGSQFTRSSVMADLQAIEAAMRVFKKAPTRERRGFCAFLVFPLREEHQRQSLSRAALSSKLK